MGLRDVFWEATCDTRAAWLPGSPCLSFSRRWQRFYRAFFVSNSSGIGRRGLFRYCFWVSQGFRTTWERVTCWV